MVSNMTLPMECYFLTFNPDEIMFGRSYYLAAFVMSAMLLVPSAFLNLLLLISIYISLALRKPSTLFLYSLSVSDLLIAVVLLPIYVTNKHAELTLNFDLFCSMGIHSYFFGYAFSAVSIFTVTALSIDRFLILFKGIHYSEYVTKTKVIITVVLIWVTSIFLSSLQYVIPAPGEIINMIAGIVTALCFFVTVTFYCQMLLKLRKTRLEARQLSESTQEIPSISKYRKITVTMVMLFMVFIFCYLPFFCVIIAINAVGSASKGMASIKCVATVITYTRAFINPLILLCRTTEVKEAAKFIIRRVMCL